MQAGEDDMQGAAVARPRGTGTPGAVFHDRARPSPRAADMLRPAMARHRRDFPTWDALRGWFRYIFTPASDAWAFKPNGKTGTTSTLYLLFRLEFGHPLTARQHEPDGILADHAAHELAAARVFSLLTERQDVADALAWLEAAPLRLTTVRHPMSRAISAFRYLCKADEAQVSRFLKERLRMTARTGFDWTRHPHTAEGFVRYLEFLRMELAHDATLPVDWHLRPQVMNIRPEILRPHLIGRTEDLPAFFAAIAERLDRPLPEGLDLAPKNRTQGRGDDLAADPAARTLVQDIFAMDFESFGYDP
jgi:hypothetical protein